MMFDGDANKLAGIVYELVRSKREGNYWDYKREWHSDKVELLHDIICLANNLEHNESYLIIGVDEEADYQFLDVTEDIHRFNTQKITDWLTHVKWFGARWPNVEVVPLHMLGGTIDVVVIESFREAMPYCLEMPNGRLGAFKVYIRRNDTNTPINESATTCEVEALWRHRFGLDMAPLDTVPQLLKARGDWEYKSRITNCEDLYYRFDPRFVIEQEHDDDLDGFEYYMFGQCDTHPSWYTIRVSYLGQQIYDCQGVAIDGGRYFTAVPDRSFFRWENGSILEPGISYCYYVEGSLNWALHEFFYEDRRGEEEIAHDRFVCNVLYFKSEDERLGFEEYLRTVRPEIERRLAEKNDPYIDMGERETAHAIEVYKEQLKFARLLKEVLLEYDPDRLEESRIITPERW